MSVNAQHRSWGKTVNFVPSRPHIAEESNSFPLEMATPNSAETAASWDFSEQARGLADLGMESFINGMASKMLKQLPAARMRVKSFGFLY